MACRKYLELSFNQTSRAVIEDARSIVAEYQAQGFSLTLRQLYYQFVSRNLLANRQSEYKRLGAIVSNGRLAGLIDWLAIEDRTRNLEANSHWASPRGIIDSCVACYATDKWGSQPKRVEAWIEKDALLGVISGVCERLDVPYFSCRGYTSQSEMWRASQRLLDYIASRQRVILLHLGDHDPSGLDMTRDIRERLELFLGDEREKLTIKRIALNRKQIAKYRLPRNPTKVTDSRAADYIAEHGESSWELDAIEPQTLAELIETHILAIRDEVLWHNARDVELTHKRTLEAMRDNWEAIADQYRMNGDEPEGD